jgi:hypothetical protein
MENTLKVKLPGRTDRVTVTFYFEAGEKGSRTSPAIPADIDIVSVVDKKGESIIPSVSEEQIIYSTILDNSKGVRMNKGSRTGQTCRTNEEFPRVKIRKNPHIAKRPEFEGRSFDKIHGSDYAITTDNGLMFRSPWPYDTYVLVTTVEQAATAKDINAPVRSVHYGQGQHVIDTFLKSGHLTSRGVDALDIIRYDDISDHHMAILKAWYNRSFAAPAAVALKPKRAVKKKNPVCRKNSALGGIKDVDPSDPMYDKRHQGLEKAKARKEYLQKMMKPVDRFQPTWALKNMIKALQIAPWENTIVDWQRYYEAKMILEMRRRRK